MTRSVWQLAAGQAMRSYADVFLRHGVGLIGPGDAGSWTPDRDDSEYDGGFVRHFAAELAVDDIVLLRTSRSTIRAVGVVAGPYEYLEAFDDVNGWDLQHARRVRWSELPAAHDFGANVFAPKRLSRVGAAGVVEYALRYVNSEPRGWQAEPLPRLPDPEPLLDRIPEPLVPLVAQVTDLAPFYWDREGFGDHPNEHEAVAHLVVPLLRALGWPPERLAVEWRDVDVAVFARLPRTPENLAFLVEAKRFGSGVEGALDQARGYLTALGVQRDVVVTDGVRYRLYDAAADFAPGGYANLDRLKVSAPKLFDRLARP